MDDDNSDDNDDNNGNEAKATMAVMEEQNIVERILWSILEMCIMKACMFGMRSMKKWQTVLTNTPLWDPLETCKSMKMHL
jgi:hypothetical protein